MKCHTANLKKLLAYAIHNIKEPEYFCTVRSLLRHARSDFKDINVLDGAAVCGLMEAQVTFDNMQ